MLYDINISFSAAKINKIIAFRPYICYYDAEEVEL